MKVIINALSARKGGIVTYTNNLARSLMKRDIEPIFAISNNFHLDENVPSIRLDIDYMPPVRRLIWEQTVWRYIVAKHKPDILFSSANFGLLGSPVPQVLLVREGGLFDPFYLVNIGPSLGIQSILNRSLRRRLIIASARSSQNVLVPTKALKNLIISWAGDLEGRIKVNEYGTISKFYSDRDKDRKWREGDLLRILYISAYYPHKQPGLISEAVCQLNKQGIRCELTLTMELEDIDKTFGGAKDLFLLKKGVERGQVKLVGNKGYDRLPDIYNAHDLFVFPSLSETFGHPLAEAMSTGLPIIASDTLVHREVCKGAALYFSPLSVSDLVKKIGLLIESQNLRESITTAGKKNVKDNYIWESHVNRLINDFRKIKESYDQCD